jgi:hypothetical protein
MFHPRRHSIALLLAVCPSFLSLTVALAADQPAAWVPKDAVFYLGVPDCDKLVESAKKSSAWAMYNDPQVSESMNQVRTIATKIQGVVAKHLGLENPGDLEVYPHGGAAMFMSFSPPTTEGADPEAHGALVLEMRGDSDRMRRLAEVATNKCVENGARKETKEAAGGEFTIVRFPKSEAVEGAEAPASPFINDIIEVLRSSDAGFEEFALAEIADELSEVRPPEQFVFAIRDTKFLLATDEEITKQLMQQLREGPDESLAAGPAMRLLKSRCEIEASIHFVFNLPRLMELSMATDAEGAKFVRALGLDKFGPFVASIEIAPTDELDSRVRGFLEIGDMNRGLGRIVAMPNTRTAPPSTAGADTIVFGVANVQPAVVLGEVVDITTRIDPEAGERMRTQMKAPLPDGSVLDIQNDVVAHLTGPIFAAFSAKSPYGPDEINLLIGLGHKSRQAMDRLLSLTGPGMLQPREMMGSVVYQLMMIPIPGVSMGLSDRSFLPIGTTPAVEAHIRAEGREGGGLAEEPAFRRAARFVPDQSCAMMYVDALKLFDAQLAITKMPGFKDEQPMFGSPAGALLQRGIGEQFQWGELPNPEAMRKYQSQAIGTVSTESEGLRFDLVSPRPKQN